MHTTHYQGDNVMLKSETGSGKTLAYLLPIINDLAQRVPRVTREHGTLAIVLAPTRELSVQVRATSAIQCCTHEL
jgi:ATP-dependent RNA helicase DDX31/DBP7